MAFLGQVGFFVTGNILLAEKIFCHLKSCVAPDRHALTAMSPCRPFIGPLDSVPRRAGPLFRSLSLPCFDASRRPYHSRHACSPVSHKEYYDNLRMTYYQTLRLLCM